MLSWDDIDRLAQAIEPRFSALVWVATTSALGFGELTGAEPQVRQYGICAFLRKPVATDVLLPTIAEARATAGGRIWVKTAVREGDDNIHVPYQPR